MKKRVLALLMCVLLAVGTVPAMPVADYFGIEVGAVNIENLEQAISSVPDESEWYRYRDTERLRLYFEIAVQVMQNPDGFQQSYIDTCAQNLKNEIDALEYHTLGIVLNETTYTAAVGNRFTLRAILTPAEAADPVVWESDNEEAVSVTQNGEVTVKKYAAEPVNVIVSSNGYQAVCTVNILNPLGGIRLEKSTLEVFEGDKAAIGVIAYGKDEAALPTDKVSYTYKSNNTSVAAVDASGNVTGIRKGEATVTVTATSGGEIYTAVCTVRVNETIPVNSLSSAELTTSSTINLTVNETRDFNVVVLPSNASNKKLEWTCSDDSVLKITDKGTNVTGVATAELKALKAGCVEVTFATTDGSDISKTFTVVVKPLISSLTFAEETKVLTLNTSGERFKTTITPADAGNQVLTWTSSDTTVCKVDYNGVLYPQSLGTCYITATTQDGTNIRVTGFVRVSEMASLVTLNKNELTLKVPGHYQLSATVLAIDGTSYKDVQWSSGDTKIATVDKNGLVTAKYPGTVVIKAMAIDGTEKYDNCIVTVLQPLEDLVLPKTKNVYVGETATVSATFVPEYASNKKVTWSSSDTSVATVNQNGVVTGKSEGQTTITCVADDGGIVATCVVSVLIKTTGVSLNYTTSKIWKDKTVTLVPTISPADATVKDVSWTSSDTSVATVDENGIVTGIAGGTCVITCKTKDGGKTATCTITVLESATGISFASEAESLYLGQVITNKASVLPATATNRNVTYATSNDLVVRVSQTGEITAVGEGKAVVTAKSEDGGFVATCNVTVYSKIPVTGLTLDKSTLSLDVGEYYTFLATVYPSNASNKAITWRTSNSSVVSVSQTGLIKGKAAGTAIVSATTDDGNFVRECKVTVTQPVTGIRLNAASISLAKGKSKTIVANVLPTNATNKEVMWDSTDEEVARVSSNGVVNAVGAGNCTITATTVDGFYTATCDINVYIPVTGITIGAESIKLPRGESRLLSATVSPSDATNRTVIWQSSNTNVVTVNEAGQLTGRTRGTAVVYATTADGAFQASCTVEVVQLATGVSLNYASITLDVGATKQFSATLTPATVSDTTVKWSSSNKSVFTVSSKGLIKGVGPGTATLTCTSGDGAVKTTCKITVTQPVTGLTLSPTKVTVKEGGIKAITATVVPANATDSKVLWVSSNKAVATVDADGVVRGIKPGKATITAVSNNNSEITAACTVTVVRPVTGMTLNKASITMDVGNTTTITPIFTPEDAGIKTAKWTSSNYDVADVDSNGKVTAKGPGYAVITAKSTDGGFTATCDILVIQPVTGVKLSSSALSLEVDEKSTLKATVLPSNASNTSVKWSSSNKAVATVSSSGVVTGVSQGTATITCKTVDGSFTKTCTVTVLKKVTGVSLNYTSKVLYLGKTLTLKATVFPTDATNKTVTWSSSNKNIATVSTSGKVTPLAPGSVTITVKTSDGAHKATCKIEVRKPVESIKLNATSKTIYVDDLYQLKATVLPDDATVRDVTWTVSDPTVLTVSSKGLITGKSAGVATVTATAENGLKATCKVTVRQSVEGIGLDKDALTVYTGETSKIKATVLPEGAYNQGVKWNSSNVSVAKVSSTGVVTGVKAGTAVITATTSEGGYTATCTVTVKQHVTSIGFNTTRLDIEKGKQGTLQVNVLPADASDKSYEITSSDPSIVFVDQNGLVIGLMGGTATVTVTAKDNGKTGICYVTVLEPVTGVSLEKEEDTVFVGKEVTLNATVSPSDATNQLLTWSSSAPEVASVNSAGIISIHKAGTAEITVTTVDGGFTDSCVLTCLQAPEKLEMPEEITVLRGESGKISVNVLPEDSFNKNITFESSDESIVSIDAEGNFEALAPGQSTVTVKAEMGDARSECLITVIEPVTNVEIRESKLTLYKGDEYDFRAVISPANASNQEVIWKVSNGLIGAVDSEGHFTARSKGETYVTVTAVDGRFIDFCKVNVVLAVEDIEISKNAVSLIEGESEKVTASVLPNDAYDTSVRFESADESIATVDKNGVITAVSKGETVITVSSVDNPEIKAQIAVEVIRVVDSIELSFSEEFLWVGESGNVEVTFIPADPNDKSVVFSSSDESIAAVDENGVVTAIGAGEAVITVTTTDGRATKDITVEIRKQAEGIEISETEKTVSVDDVFTLTASVLPSEAYNKDVIWTSSDEEILTVDNGTVTALKTGEAVITVKSAENEEIKAECKVTVIRMAQSIELDFDKEYLWVGESGTVSVTVLPDDTTDKSVSFSSSDEAIATVDENGVVTAIGAGEAVITVTTTDGRATKDITVEIRKQVEGIEISEMEKTVSVDDVFTLTASVLPSEAYNKDVIWSSSDEEILKVENGTVTALKTGEAVITVKSAENEEIKAECKVTVIRMAQSIELSFDKEYLWVGESGTASVTVLPEDTTDKRVSFKSSDESVATVDENGIVTAIGAGTVTITAKTVDGRAVDFVQLEVRKQVEGIEISETEKTVSVDDVFTLTASVLPAEAYNKDVIWSSSDEEILKVENGTVTALKTGDAVITVKSAENEEIKAECKVTVIRMAQSIELSFDKEYLWVGETGNVTVNVLPEDTTDKSVSFSSSDEAIATVDENGVVTAIGAGEAVITVTTTDGRATKDITVEIRKQVEGIEISETEKTVSVDDVFTLTASVLPAEAYNKDVIWSSSDEEILKVENGTVTALKTGEAVITVKSAENEEIKAECKVKVIRYISSIEFAQESVTVLKGETYQLSTVILPEDATERELTFVSSDEAVATVDESGLVTAVGAGKATVTVKTALEDVFAECEINVEVRSEEITLDKNEAEIYCGDTLTLTATVLPDDATNKSIIWESSDISVATVEDGIVTAVSTGTAVITAKTEDTGKTAECKINVLRHVDSVEISSRSVKAYVGREFTLTARVNPDDATNTTLFWKSSDTTVATVDNGVVTPLRRGTAIISVYSEDGGYADFCFVTVGIGIDAVTLNESSIAIDKGETFTLTAEASPENTTESELIWTSSDDSIASVENGIVTAKEKSGTVTVKATAADNSEAFAVCEVTVIEPVTAVDLNKTEARVLLGKTETLSAIVSPANATYKDVTFSSSDESVATVDANGVVTPVAPGTASIICTSTSGQYTAVCVVTVPRPVDDFRLTFASMALSKGASGQIEVEANPANHDERFVFVSSDPNILTVERETGIVKGVGAGTATVTAISDLTEKTATIEILVVQPVEGISFEMKSFNGAYTGMCHQLNYTITPADAYNKKVTFTSSDERIATVDKDGYITYHEQGQVTITVTSEDSGLSDECVVTVSKAPEEIHISKNKLSLSVGEEYQFDAVVLPLDATDVTVIWSSSSDAVVSVDSNGKATAVGTGTALIFARTWNGKEAYCTVTVE